MRGPLRWIVAREVYVPKGAASRATMVRLRLECGHVVRVKGPKEPARRARCPFCPEPPEPPE